jgi:hypothetical protein
MSCAIAFVHHPAADAARLAQCSVGTSAAPRIVLERTAAADDGSWFFLAFSGRVDDRDMSYQDDSTAGAGFFNKN